MSVKSKLEVIVYTEAQVYVEKEAEADYSDISSLNIFFELQFSVSNCLLVSKSSFPAAPNLNRWKMSHRSYSGSSKEKKITLGISTEII